MPQALHSPGLTELCRTKAVLAPQHREHECSQADKQSHTHKAHQALWLPCFYQGEAASPEPPPTSPGAGCGAWCSRSPQQPWPGPSIAPAPAAGSSSSALGERDNSTGNSTDNPAGLRGLHHNSTEPSPAHKPIAAPRARRFLAQAPGPGITESQEIAKFLPFFEHYPYSPAATKPTKALLICELQS